jgi:hypothetical protein
MRGDDEDDLAREPAAGDFEPVVAERQPRRQAQLGPQAAPSASAAILEPAMPVDRVRSRRQLQPQGRGQVLLGDDLRRAEPERRRPLLLGRGVGGLFRVGRQPERGDQPGQQLLVRLVHDPERIDMPGGDADQTGDMAQRVEPVHRAPGSAGVRKNAAQPAASSTSTGSGSVQ